MRNKRLPSFLAVVVAFAAVCLGSYCVYATFVKGRTAGPDFIAAVMESSIGVDDVLSLESVVPPGGHTPFSRLEMDSLRRRSKISAKSDLAELFVLLSRGARGNATQSHPVTIYSSYWLVNIRNGDFYYLYVNLLEDKTKVVCSIEANSRNGTNPNGAHQYYFDDFDSLLRLTGEDQEFRRKQQSKP